MTVVVMVVVAAGVATGWDGASGKHPGALEFRVHQTDGIPMKFQCCVGTGIDLGKQEER